MTQWVMDFPIVAVILAVVATGHLALRIHKYRRDTAKEDLPKICPHVEVIVEDNVPKIRFLFAVGPLVKMSSCAQCGAHLNQIQMQTIVETWDRSLNDNPKATLDDLFRRMKRCRRVAKRAGFRP